MESTSTPNASVIRRPDRCAAGASSQCTSRPRRRRAARADNQPLGRYCDGRGRLRELVTKRGFAGSVLVLDRDAETGRDRRLVAHLAADEPAENAGLVCRGYLQDARRDSCRPRLLTPEDTRTAPFADLEPADASAVECDSDEPVDAGGGRYRLERLETGMSIPELRWRRHRLLSGSSVAEPVSVREAVAGLQSYEPVYALTMRALERHRSDVGVSTSTLRAELERVLNSPIVLNRGLREALLRVLEREELSMSEIAIRCGRVKRDARGKESGETSWLARRLGLLPEGGKDVPTPWIHSDVLALIARRGLGVSPREVELG
jgi:hypothetical protein